MGGAGELLIFVVLRVQEKVALECGAGCKSNVTM